MKPDAEPLTSFPNLESLKFHGYNRQSSSHSSKSEWWFMVPAVTREGQLPVCLLSRVLIASAQVGQHFPNGRLGASVAQHAAHVLASTSQPQPSTPEELLAWCSSKYVHLDCCVVCPAWWCAEQHKVLLLPALHHTVAPASGLLGPCLLHQQSVMQGWREQGLVLLCTPTGRTHHTAV